jgi:hypothetical protein
MKTFDFIEATISHQLKDPHSKVLEPDCLSPSASNYDTVSKEAREGFEDLFLGRKKLFAQKVTQLSS